MKQKNIEIYQAKNGAIELSVDAKKETIWASQQQIADVFNLERSVVTKHIGNILKNKEVDEKSNVQKMHIANSDKPVSFYSLDMILAVGYRANSSNAIIFRKWASKILRNYITNGFVINPSRIEQNYEKFLIAVEETKKLLPSDDRITARDAMELVKMFAGTWFAIERKGSSLAGIVGNVFQAFGGKDLYPTIEEKAVHLLYFVVKNHPFVDGNKRSGAFSFIWFLQKAGFDFRKKITPEALTALTLLIAESNPKDKDRVIGLVLLLLKK